MSLIKRMMKQRAVYWPVIAGHDQNGNPNLGDPVAIRCRWEDVNEAFVSSSGTTLISASKIYVPIDIPEGSYIWKHPNPRATVEEALEDAPADPVGLGGGNEIKRFDKMPDLKAKEFLRTAFL